MTLSTQIGRVYNYAKLLAEYYLTIKRIKEVWLFGSVAVNGDGSDIDLILVVNRKIFETYIDEMNRRIDYHPKNITAEKFASWRFEIIQTLVKKPLLPPDFDEFDYPVDLVLLPLGWEQNIEKLERLSFVLKKRFLEKNLVQAMPFDPIVGDFLSPSS